MAPGIEEFQQDQRAGLTLQLVLAALVVITGSLNNIFKQIASATLGSYTYMLQLTTAVVFVPVYCGAAWCYAKKGWIPTEQISFIWQTDRSAGIPVLALFLAAALGDAVGDSIGMICTPYVAGPIHSLLANFTPIWIAVLAFAFLGKRYSLFQCAGMLAVLVAAGVGVTPTMEEGSGSGTSPYFAVVLAGSCIFNAVSWLVKEHVFSRYAGWKASRGINDGGSMHIILVQAHLAAFALPLTLLCVPLNQSLGQMHGETTVSYLSEGSACMLGYCEGEFRYFATKGVALYFFFNLAWNISILMSVKVSGALATFIALKGIFPVSSVLFSSICWPVLCKTAMQPLVWLSVFLMLPAIVFYQYASDLQQKSKNPSQAPSCWPLGKPNAAFLDECLLEGGKS